MAGIHGAIVRYHSNRTVKPSIFSLLATFLLCSMLLACAEFPQWLRRRTYPPDFNYITQEELRSKMWQLAKEVRELHLLVQDTKTTDEGRRAQILKLLMAMEQTTDELKTEGRSSNHPLIDAHLAPFRRDVSLARQAVQKSPPDYFLVGSVTGACVYCHGESPKK